MWPLQKGWFKKKELSDARGKQGRLDTVSPYMWENGRGQEGIGKG
jgi:hypothetical protein